MLIVLLLARELLCWCWLTIAIVAVIAAIVARLFLAVLESALCWRAVVVAIVSIRIIAISILAVLVVLATIALLLLLLLLIPALVLSWWRILPLTILAGSRATVLIWRVLATVSLLVTLLVLVVIRIRHFGWICGRN